MRQILVNRLIQALMVAWGVGTLTFIFMRSLPGDMAYRIAAGRYGQDNVNAAAADMVRAELGLDQPVLSAYFTWLTDLLQGNLGVSLISGAPVFQEVQHQLSHSLLLAAVALLISALIALPIGIACGMRTGGWFDRSLLAVSALLRAQPVFVVGLLLILAFAVHIPLLPVAGYGTASHLVLPAFSLALVLAAVSSRVIRDSTQTVVQSDYYQFSRVKGLPAAPTFQRHGLRNLSVPVIAFLGVQLITLIEGIVMIESLFAWPGIGHALAHAIFSRDIPMIQGAALMMGLLFVILNTLIDLACHWADPRGQLA
ncbi:ABC transporter permease [Saccharospirillum alexandrii]|uniref:ABC transporter permease n=1 Tax=Saccharospirillum alexandrii TaxID=2448477 RepID=UPI000FDA4E58|nr:ABC transporter permease [Saccharospirillum alexandrii]